MLDQQEFQCHCRTSVIHSNRLKWSANSTPPIVSFLKTISHRPALAQYVRMLNLTGTEVDVRFSADGLPPIPAEALDLDAISRIMARIEIPFADEWMTELTKGAMDALLALLISQTPILTKPSIGRFWSKRLRLLCMVIAAGFDSYHVLPTFHRLSEVSLDWFTDDCIKREGKHTKALLSFFYLNNIEKLRVQLDNPTTLTWPAQAPSCVSIASLDLSDIDESQLYTLLQATPNIKRLRWGLYRSSLQDILCHKQVLDLNDLMKALGLFRGTLEALAIYLDASSEDLEDHEMQIVGSIKDLSNFTAIRTLRLPLLWLDNFSQDEECSFTNTVPRSVQQLTFVNDLWLQLQWSGDEEKVIRGIERMLADREACFPELHSMLMVIIEDDDWSVEHRERVQQLGQTHRFQLSLEEHTWTSAYASGREED